LIEPVAFLFYGGEMARRKFYLASLTLVLIVFAGACVNEDRHDNQKVEKSGQQSEAESAVVGIVDFIKKQKLVNFKSTTIGHAFDSYRYLTKKEWKAAVLQSRHVTVDFTGWFERETLSDKDIRDGITGRALEIKFVIEPNGSFYVFMVSKIESKSDGKVYRFQSDDIAGILDNIYANKNIAF
jgi:hypothetical protein